MIVTAATLEGPCFARNRIAADSDVACMKGTWLEQTLPGMAIMKIYNGLRHTVDGPDRHMRPYFDDLKRAYLRRRKKPAQAAAETNPEE